MIEVHGLDFFTLKRDLTLCVSGGAVLDNGLVPFIAKVGGDGLIVLFRLF